MLESKLLAINLACQIYTVTLAERDIVLSLVLAGYLQDG